VSQQFVSRLGYERLGCDVIEIFQVVIEFSKEIFGFVFRQKKLKGEKHVPLECWHLWATQHSDTCQKTN